MMNLLRMRHEGPYARKPMLNSARYSPRICVHLISPCHFLATAPIARAGAVPATRCGVS
jgi:hypothetical protein